MKRRTIITIAGAVLGVFLATPLASAIPFGMAKLGVKSEEALSATATTIVVAGPVAGGIVARRTCGPERDHD
jgi:hypothetical protein